MLCVKKIKYKIVDNKKKKENFHFVLNEPIKSCLPEGKFNCSLNDFMDYALLCADSLFTVGVAEEERDTASVTEMADAPECAHKMASTAEPDRKMADTTTARYITAVNHESIQTTVDSHESSQVTVDHHESGQVTIDHRESSQVTVDLYESGEITLDHHESSQVTVNLHESSHVSTDRHLPESLHVSADHPEPRHVTADQPESCHVLSATPRYSRSVLLYPSLISSVSDAQLMSAHAAGIPKPAHFNPPVPALIPLSEALPMMGIALCCVWAAYTTSELPQAMAPAAASPEVAAHAAEPPEAAVLA